jgi:hypothetical protein
LQVIDHSRFSQFYQNFVIKNLLGWQRCPFLSCVISVVEREREREITRVVSTFLSIAFQIKKIHYFQ